MKLFDMGATIAVVAVVLFILGGVALDATGNGAMSTEPPVPDGASDN